MNADGVKIRRYESERFSGRKATPAFTDTGYDGVTSIAWFRVPMIIKAWAEDDDVAIAWRVYSAGSTIHTV